MPESMTPLIILGVVGVLFVLLLSLLTNNYSLNNIKSKTVGDGQYGTARWATDQEIRKAYVTVPFDVASWRAGKKRPTVQGLVLGSVQRGKRLEALVDRDDVHCLMIGASGVGKTAFFLYPNIEFACACGMSFLILDTKGDLARNCGRIAQKYYGYRVSVVDLRNPIRSDKRDLPTRGYTILSVNSMLASLNSFLVFCGRADCKVKLYRVQKKTYLAANRELSKAEYLRLLHAARKDQRLWLLLQTLCATGIRVSELQYFTVEAVQAGEISVACKNKTRSILIPRGLQNILLQYVRSARIESGHIFRTRTGKPMNRSNIWSAMKRLCAQANVNPDKVFPHNLRKLFARTFYRMEKDIAKLADILGHSSINTTRIYIMSTGTEHRHQMEKLGLLA